jgi:hypothetical protein
MVSFSQDGGQAKISLRKTFDPTAESSLDLHQSSLRDMHRDQGAFVEVDRQTSRIRKLIQQLLEPHRSRQVSTHNDESVVGILQYRTGSTINDGVAQEWVLSDKLLQHIRNQQEKVRRERVALP